MAKLVDTLLVTGCTTSGGVQAIATHEANYFDMEQKFADLVTAEEVESKFTQLAQ